MIQLPKRSVTRFFIPLIDVLTLLFCIFLLMPMIKATGGDQGFALANSGPVNDVTADRPSIEDLQSLKSDHERVGRERRELEQLRSEKIETLQRRLFIQVLEIDADTGKLFHYESGQRLEIPNQEESLQLIARHQEEAGRRELYYLFLFPRRITGYPEERQIRQYEKWFRGVAHGMDDPVGPR